MSIWSPNPTPAASFRGPPRPYGRGPYDAGLYERNYPIMMGWNPTVCADPGWTPSQPCTDPGWTPSKACNG